MSDFTYENVDKIIPLETYEWDNVWIQRTDDKKSPRVLYIGDSISCALRVFGNGVTKEEILIDSFGTSKAIDNPYYWDALRLFSLQEGHRDVVLFNNGLHGWHLDDETEYAEAYESFVRFLLDEFKGTPVILLLTTHVASPERDRRVVARNDAVVRIAEKYGLPTVDLYSVTNAEGMVGADGVHLTPEGYKLLAKAVVDAVMANS